MTLPVLVDRVYETTTTTGTGSITMAGPVLGYFSFASKLSNPSVVDYVIVDTATGDVEVGNGTWTTTLSRDTVYSSSNANALVNFAAGTKQVFVTVAAESIADLEKTFDNGLTDTAGNVKLGGTLTGNTDIPLGGYDLRFGPTTFDIPSGLPDPGILLYMKESLGYASYYATSGTGSDILSVGFDIASLSSDDYLSFGRTHWNGSSYDRAGFWQSYGGYSGAYALYAYGKVGSTVAEMTLDMSGATPVWVFTYDFKLPDYANSRNNLAASTPINFLYTDASGNVKSGALNHDIFRTAIGLGASNGLTETDGLIEQGGPLTKDTTVAASGKKYEVTDSSALSNLKLSFDVTTNPAHPAWGLYGQRIASDSYVKTGVDDIGAWMYAGWDETVNDYTFSSLGTYNKEFASLGNYLVYLYGVSEGTHGTAYGELRIDHGAGQTYMTWSTTGEWFFGSYNSARDDTSYQAPTSLLYTDTFGYLRSAPLSKVMPNGTAEIDFGAFPGSNEGSVTVTGQTMITAAKNIQLTVSCESSADYTAEDMAYIAALVGLSAGNIVAATSFTIYARSLEQLQGKIKVNWAY